MRTTAGKRGVSTTGGILACPPAPSRLATCGAQRNSAATAIGSASAAPVSSAVVSAEGSAGERALIATEVRGNVAELGFPARREIIPGIFSSGYRPRTAKVGGSVGIWMLDTVLRVEGDVVLLGLGLRDLASSERKAS